MEILHVRHVLTIDTLRPVCPSRLQLRIVLLEPPPPPKWPAVQLKVSACLSHPISTLDMIDIDRP